MVEYLSSTQFASWLLSIENQGADALGLCIVKDKRSGASNTLYWVEFEWGMWINIKLGDIVIGFRYYSRWRAYHWALLFCSSCILWAINNQQIHSLMAPYGHINSIFSPILLISLLGEIWPSHYCVLHFTALLWCRYHHFRLACLYLAAKVENEFIDGTDLIARIHPKATIEELFAAEQELLIVHPCHMFRWGNNSQALDFQLCVHHPHNCLHAYLADIRLLTKEIISEPSSPRAAEIISQSNSKNIISNWMKHAEAAANHLSVRSILRLLSRISVISL